MVASSQVSLKGISGGVVIISPVVSSSGDWLGYSGGLTDIGVSSWAAKLSTLSLGMDCAPPEASGEAATISASATGRAVEAKFVSVAGVSVGGRGWVDIGLEVARDGKGGSVLAVVVCGVLGAEEVPVNAPPLIAGMEETGGSWRGRVGVLDDTGDSKVSNPEKLGVVVD